MPTPVAIELEIRIPSNAVYYPIAGFGGAFNGGIKCKPKSTIDLDISGAASLQVPVPSWGMTHSYDENETLIVPGKPDWFRDLKANATPNESEQLERTPANLNAKFTSMDGATHAVLFEAVGANPLLLIAPAIDATIKVGLRKSGGSIQYAISASHDGFPDYTVRIDGESVYFHDCVAAGETPLALGPPEDIQATVPWTSL